MLQPAVIRQQEQALGIPVQPARRVDIFYRNEIRQGTAATRIRKLAEHIKGLVEQNQQGHRK
jgi:hypothetical protein